MRRRIKMQLALVYLEMYSTVVAFSKSFIKNCSREQNNMSNYLSERLKLSSSPDKFMTLSMTSTNNSSNCKTSNLESLQDALTFRSIENTKRQPSKNDEISAPTKTKEGVKKLTKRPLYHQKAKNTTKKGNIHQKNEISTKIRNQQPKFTTPTHKRESSIQQLQVRCGQLDQQLKKIKLKHRRTANNARRFQKDNNQYLAKALLTVQNFGKKIAPEIKQAPENQIIQATQSCVNLITLKPQSFRNSVQEQRQPKNIFFTKLKKRLFRQIEKIKQKGDLSKTRQIYAGCEIRRRNDSEDSLRVPLTERAKSKTALSRSGVCTAQRTPVKKKRPQSARQRILQSKELKYKIESIQERENFELRGIKIEYKKQQKPKKKSFIHQYTEPQANKTLRHISPLYKQRNLSATKKQVQHQKMKEKMLDILIQCEDESIKKQTIEQGIKVFESYSKQMTDRFRKTSTFITNIQYTETFQENYREEETNH